MKLTLLILITLITANTFAQQLEIIVLDKSKITTTVLDRSARADIKTQFNGQQDRSIQKQWTARTYKLSNGAILVEFYDKQALLIQSLNDLKKLDRIRFVKNTIYHLKKNVSYKIELTFDEGMQLIKQEKPTRLTKYKSDLPEWFAFEVYQLNTGQILLIENQKNLKAAAIFPDIKTLASEKTDVLEEEYGSEDEEHTMRMLASGDRLPDYDIYFHLFYPKYLDDLISNHKLSLVQQKVYVSDFFGNLYKSENDYYILVDEVNQENGAGNKMPILTLRIYDNIEQVREAERRYIEFKNRGVISEHFYQKISDHYGQKFPSFVPQLIDRLPYLLNFDSYQLSFDSIGMDLVDEALKWNGTNHELFDSWFPSILAYYGQCYINQKKDGVWTTTYDKKSKVWIPELKLTDGTSAWDWRDFYKSLIEGPIPMRWAGDWDGTIKKMRRK